MWLTCKSDSVVCVSVLNIIFFLCLLLHSKNVVANERKRDALATKTVFWSLNRLKSAFRNFIHTRKMKRNKHHKQTQSENANYDSSKERLQRFWLSDIDIKRTFTRIGQYFSSSVLFFCFIIFDGCLGFSIEISCVYVLRRKWASTDDNQKTNDICAKSNRCQTIVKEFYEKFQRF